MARQLMSSLLCLDVVLAGRHTFVSVKGTQSLSFRAQASSNMQVDISTIPGLLAASSYNHSILVHRQPEIERCLGGAVNTPNATEMIQVLLAPSDRCDATSDELCDYLAAAADRIGHLHVACVQHADGADEGDNAMNYVEDGRKVNNAVNDPLRYRQGYLDMTHLADAWRYMAAPQQPRPVILAIIDSGINEAHEDLVDMLWDDGNGHHGFNTDELIPTFDITDDVEGHGTNMAGVAAAQLNNTVGFAGVAGFINFIKIMVLKASVAHTEDPMGPVRRALSLATEHKADVVLMAFGFPVAKQTFKDAIVDAASKMVLITGTDNEPHGDVIAYPCVYQETICVTGTLSKSKQLDPNVAWGGSIDVAAPGVDITTTMIGGNDQFGRISGTSAASAIVAGVVAMMMSLGATPANAKGIIKATSDALLHFPGRYIDGGFINAHKAVQAVVERR